MSVSITESGVTFGVFPQERLYRKISVVCRIVNVNEYLSQVGTNI